MTNWYYKYKDEGRCTRCGQKLPDRYYFINCEPCRARHNRNVREWTRAKRGSDKHYGERSR